MKSERAGLDRSVFCRSMGMASKSMHIWYLDGLQGVVAQARAARLLQAPLQAVEGLHHGHLIHEPKSVDLPGLGSQVPRPLLPRSRRLLPPLHPGQEVCAADHPPVELRDGLGAAGTKGFRTSRSQRAAGKAWPRREADELSQQKGKGTYGVRPWESLRELKEERLESWRRDEEGGGGGEMRAEVPDLPSRSSRMGSAFATAPGRCSSSHSSASKAGRGSGPALGRGASRGRHLG